MTARAPQFILLAALSVSCGADVPLGAWETQANVEQPEPVADEPEPVAEEPEPVAEEPEPAADEPEPVADEPEPVADEPEPAAEEPEPVADEPEPVAEEPEPAADEPEPAADEPEPAVDEPGTPGAEPACTEPAPGGIRSPLGDIVGAANTYTDWLWQAPHESVEFDLQIETELSTDTMFWAYQFSFETGVAGLFGLQDQGLYQADPPDGPSEPAKMAVFWISGPPLIAELGDVPYPDARIAPENFRGVVWNSIHVRFDWQVCRPYRFRIEFQGADGGGNRWYGATILDRTNGDALYLGRILVPAPWGVLSTFSGTWTDRIADEPPNACEDIEYASAIFGIPQAEPGTVLPSNWFHRFEAPPRCANSRITEFDTSVRQEVGTALTESSSGP